MSGARLRLAVLVVVGLLQLTVPAHMIVARERTLREGTAWRFRTAPVDPADAFRGNYLALRFDAERAAVPAGLAVERDDRVVVPLLRDAEGFAQLGPVSREPPATGDWLRLRVGWVEKDEAGRSVAHIEIPFERFYLDEGLAPRAEAKFSALGRLGEPRPLPAWALVRVREGDAVLEDVLINGRSVRGDG
ncbi:MAG TPA: GDYXXLXY domain-containing protein [Thermoanaerobaculia bacterium]|nr:GDYXXLXY domain-containing protein [Thermoanaerobaculia bacterium]